MPAAAADGSKRVHSVTPSKEAVRNEAPPTNMQSTTMTRTSVSSLAAKRTRLSHRPSIGAIPNSRIEDCWAMTHLPCPKYDPGEQLVCDPGHKSHKLFLFRCFAANALESARQREAYASIAQEGRADSARRPGGRTHARLANLGWASPSVRSGLTSCAHPPSDHVFI
jgi:hypothetical protein